VSNPISCKFMGHVNVIKEDGETGPKYIYWYSIRIKNSHPSSEMVTFKIFFYRGGLVGWTFRDYELTSWHRVLLEHRLVI
jgi:hypothetical protein